MWLASVLRKHALTRPDSMALTDATRKISWGELSERTASLATALYGRGVRRGDRVMVLAGNSCHTLELFFTASRLGFVICPVNPQLAPGELEYIAERLDPSLVIAEQTVADLAGSLLPGVPAVVLDGDDPLASLVTEGESLPRPDLDLGTQSDAFAIFQTSATTGRPKGVIVASRSVEACFTGLALESGFGPDDSMIVPCPVFHGSVVIPLAHLAAGGGVILARDFTPQGFLHEVTRHQPTSAFLVPSMILFLLRARWSPDAVASLKQVLYGAAPMPVSLLKSAIGRFERPFRTIYGITEGGGPIATHLFEPTDLANDDAPWESSGRMLLGCAIVVRDPETGALLESGGVGEICVSGDGGLDAYWRNPEASADIARWGGVRTSDIGSIDNAGFIHLRDRINDTMIRGGQNVYPSEIERVLIAVPGVTDVAVVGLDSEEWGQTPVAFVVAEDDAEWAAVRGAMLAACRAELASYKWPTSFVSIDVVPRNAAGKILRRVLREAPQAVVR